jgi:GTP pyrophosphokinase
MRHALDASNESLCAALGALTSDDAKIEAACRRAAAVWDGDVTRARGPRAALVLCAIGADRDTLMACVLSDPRLLGRIDHSALQAEFGVVVAEQVAQMQRLMQLGEQYRRAQSADWVENLRRLLLSSISDVRVMLIQLVHRLERLRGLAFEPDEAKRRQLAAETLDVYAPIAHRLGLGQIKWELEDLAFRHLEPATYKRIASLIDERRDEREAYLTQVRLDLAQALQAAGIKARVMARPKHIFSIWGKMQRKKLSFDALFDVRAVRVEVDTVADCYAALSVVHNRFPAIESEYDDYIARPKDNGYQSLHTAVLAFEGKAVEVQIRTGAMHAQAELGVAAHWRYKEGGGSAADPFAAELNRLRQALAAGNPTEPMAAMVYVFTPQGDIFALPSGSTVLDYAYRVHSLVGHRCKGAKINGQIVPLKTVLSQADRVEILTQTNPAPSREWASAQAGFLHSASSRAKVRNWFHQLDQSAARASGAAQCDRLFRRLGLNRQAQNQLIAALNFKSMDALFDAVGQHRLDAATLLHTARVVLKPVAPEPDTKAPVFLDQTLGMGLSLDGMKAQPAGCCHPRPGDLVRAFITRGQGLSLHKQDCRNLAHLAQQFPERILSVDWPSGQLSWAQTVRLDVLVEDVARFWSDIGPVLAPFKARILESRSRLERNSGLNDIALHIELPGAVDASPLIKRLQGLLSVESVQRRAS